MFTIQKFSLLFFMLTGTLLAGIRVVEVNPTPEPETVLVRIVFPQPYEQKKRAPVNVQMRIEGFPLGIMSPFERSKMLRNNKEGQSIHVLIDNMPYIALDESVEDSFDENREYYDKILSFAIPYKLKPGPHLIRAFPARSYGESLKSDGCFDASIFYFKQQRNSSIKSIDLDAPYLTYNEPQGRYNLKNDEPVLLDFYLSNCQLSVDGYRVRLKIDGQEIMTITKWAPYYLYGFSPGEHCIRLELIDKNYQLVPGPFNTPERTITIE